MHENRIKSWSCWTRRVPIQTSKPYASGLMDYPNEPVHGRSPKFTIIDANLYLDIKVKRAALKVSPSVVSLVSFTGDEELYQCSGIIIEKHESSTGYTGIVITSANLFRPKTNSSYGDNIIADNLKVIVNLADGKSSIGEICTHDFHYNFAILSFKSDSPFQTATLRRLEDCLSLNPSSINPEEKSFQLHPHSNSMIISPGDDVVAVGRYFSNPFDLMAAPGEYCLECTENNCKELFMTTCLITRCGDGGPLINMSGEVIGIAMHDVCCTPFMPINVACKWWEHYKMFGEIRRLSLGMEAISFHTALLFIAEKIIQRFPNISKGVIVEKVIPGSSAESAGLRLDDVIVQCGGKAIYCFLQFFEVMWDNVGHPVDLVVVRGDHATPLALKLVVESTSENLNRWPLFNP